ncbi:gamma-aminobutyric acid type B receptor subunit 2-like isoform X3 [Centruroides vittatus]|uniref:gamma-aminobutyric acid type B receptor subunit 2-like isoform X3 n=1 Tax=Centruroides vittatus TaxID=120091 RepID=UPI00350FF2F6
MLTNVWTILWLTTLTHSRTVLHIGGFFPTTENRVEGHIGRGVIPSVNLALQHINNSPRFLRGYKLEIYWNDTECDPAVGMKNLFDMLYSKPSKIVLFGAACTSVTDPIAKTSQFFHLTQMTYADTHPMYTSKSYPNFFRIVPSESEFNPARVAILRHFKWTRVGTIYQNAPRYSLPHAKLLTDLDRAKIQIAATQGFAEGLEHELKKLKEKDVRIILGNFNEKLARRIFCEAYKLEMFGRKYQWIIVGIYQQYWWRVKDENVSCTHSQILQALEGYIATDVLTLSTSENITISGMTPSEYEAEYMKKRENEYSRFHGYAYDGIWAIALAIQTVIGKIRIRSSSLLLRDFRYSDPTWGKLFKEAFNETSFNGVTGHVSFVNNERQGSIAIKQFQDGEEVNIGEYHSVTSRLEFKKGKSIMWRGSGPPADQTRQDTIRVRVSRVSYLILSALALLGILSATIFLSINIKYRNQRYIKMSSPYLNNLIIIGCILTYTSVILLGLDSEMTSEKHFRYVCTARAWVLMSGFTLAFGSMFSKTWRVHAIFTNIKLNKKMIKDYKLFMVVGVLVIIDIAILVTWQIVDPFYRDTSTGEPELSSENDDVQIIPVMEFCQSERMSIFLGSIYAYKGLLMAFGCFLAWETRHVSIPALNDSKYIGMSVYNVVIMCVMGAAVSYLLREHQDAAFVIISSFIIFCSTATLCLVFVPKLFELWRNPHGAHTRVRATLKPLKKSRRSSQDETIHCRLKLLQEDNRKYRKKLEETTLKLQKIMAKLKELEEPLIIISHGMHVSSPIMEDSSSPCEEIVISYGATETYSEEISKSSYISTEMQLLEIKPEYQTRKISAHSVRFPILEVDEEPTRVRAEKSCPELNHSPTDVIMNNKISLRPRSLLEEFSLIAKYADASSSSESPPTPRAHDDEESRVNKLNEEEGNARYSRLIPPETIRRHSAELPQTASRVSVIQERHYVPHTVRKPYRSSRHLSQPTIKCDIVEYL